MAFRKSAYGVGGALAAILALVSCATDTGGPSTNITASAAPAPAAQPAPQAATPAQPSYAEKLAQMKLEIPYTKYVLKNGLTLLVNEDHKTPTVYFNIWYHVA